MVFINVYFLTIIKYSFLHIYFNYKVLRAKAIIQICPSSNCPGFVECLSLGSSNWHHWRRHYTTGSTGANWRNVLWNLLFQGLHSPFILTLIFLNRKLSVTGFTRPWAKWGFLAVSMLPGKVSMPKSQSLHPGWLNSPIILTLFLSSPIFGWTWPLRMTENHFSP